MRAGRARAQARCARTHGAPDAVMRARRARTQGRRYSARSKYALPTETLAHPGETPAYPEETRAHLARMWLDHRAFALKCMFCRTRGARHTLCSHTKG